MICPRCGAAMEERALGGLHGREVRVDVCQPCQSIWFDAHESLQLTPAATLELFAIIGEHPARPEIRDGDVLKCPRCQSQLRRTRDMQRSTRFEYLRCPHEHGRLISFFEFLKKKDFIKPLTPQQLAELRERIQQVACAHCGAAIDLAGDAACPHCGSPLTLLDLKHAGEVVDQLRRGRRRPSDG